MYTLVSNKTLEIYRKIFSYLHDVLAPQLRPKEIITDYEANLYYALGETYLESHIGGSVFYYVQNLYKKLCGLNLSKTLETNSSFRNIYHMLLMLPLLPVNTIVDGFENIETQTEEMGLNYVLKPLIDYVRNRWIDEVTPELFCVHRLENRISENVIAPFKKLRDFLLQTKGKAQGQKSTITHVIGKILELESFMRNVYSKRDKKSYTRDLSNSQKRSVLRAWQYIEMHPKIDLETFFSKVLGYIKCMENQLWIWGYYGFIGDADDVLISPNGFIASGSSSEESTKEIFVTQGDFEGDFLIENEIVMSCISEQSLIDADEEVISAKRNESKRPKCEKREYVKKLNLEEEGGIEMGDEEDEINRLGVEEMGEEIGVEVMGNEEIRNVAMICEEIEVDKIQNDDIGLKEMGRKKAELEEILIKNVKSEEMKNNEIKLDVANMEIERKNMRNEQIEVEDPRNVEIRREIIRNKEIEIKNKGNEEVEVENFENEDMGNEEMRVDEISNEEMKSKEM